MPMYVAGVRPAACRLSRMVLAKRSVGSPCTAFTGGFE
ncbi:Uncharacterised protein [Mycobacteroides abscessus subsp. abscessus]|nr:Uncharacterised protein [Mycobacteroides abscessus subsp. abscessus]